MYIYKHLYNLMHVMVEVVTVGVVNVGLLNLTVISFDTVVSITMLPPPPNTALDARSHAHVDDTAVGHIICRPIAFQCER